MTNYEKHFGSVADAADFIQRHTTCFVCPTCGCGGFDGNFDDCEEAIIEWLLEEVEE